MQVEPRRPDAPGNRAVLRLSLGSCPRPDDLSEATIHGAHAPTFASGDPMTRDLVTPEPISLISPPPPGGLPGLPGPGGPRPGDDRHTRARRAPVGRADDGLDRFYIENNPLR